MSLTYGPFNYIMVYITDDVMTHVHERLSIYEATESICIVSVLIFTFCVNDM